MASVLDKIVKQKLIEIEQAKSKVSVDQLELQLKDASPPRNFLTALQRFQGVSLIAEVKKASPSKGLIRADFDPVDIARTYEKNGASCISVLTDEHFFQGHLRYLADVRESVNIPVLRKDFILDPYQVLEARVAGADAVLLIAECLEAERLNVLHDEIVALGMTPLVELYDASNVEKVVACGAQLIGINNRDLRTFETNLEHTIKVKELLPDEATIVGESGIFTRQDVVLLASAGVDAMLVGESLMRSDDIGLAVKQLLGEA